MKLDPKSTGPRQVTVVVYVDGEEYVKETHQVEEWAVPHVAAAACVQVEDPDYRGFAEAIAHGEA